jgi:hypothetical protein
MMWVIHTGYIKAALQVIMGKDVYFFVKIINLGGLRFFHFLSLVSGCWVLVTCRWLIGWLHVAG